MNRRSTKLKRKTWADHLGLDNPSRAIGLESTSRYMLFILTARAFANLNHSTTGPHGCVRARQTPTSLIFPRPYRQHYSPLARSEETFCDIQICDCVHHLLARLAICSVDTTIHLPKMLFSQHFLAHAFENHLKNFDVMLRFGCAQCVYARPAFYFEKLSSQSC